MSLIHKNVARKGPGKRGGRALHPLPSVSASPRTSRSGGISTDAEDSVDKDQKVQVSGFRSSPGTHRS